MMDKEAQVKKQIDLMLSRAYWKGRIAGLLELKTHYMNDLELILQKSETKLKEVENELRNIKDEFQRNQNTERNNSENNRDAPETNKETGE